MEINYGKIEINSNINFILYFILFITFMLQFTSIKTSLYFYLYTKIFYNLSHFEAISYLVYTIITDRLFYKYS